MKLIDLLREVLLESKPITLDKSVVPQMEKVYNSFKKLENDEIVKWHFRKSDEPIKLSRIKFKNQYDPKFTGVTVFLGYDDDLNTRGWYNYVKNTITMNFNSKSIGDKSTFMIVLYHELVHAIDPKLNNKKVSTSLDKKLDIDKSDDDIKYLKDPAEFDAFSSAFVNQIKDGLELLSDSDKQKAKAALKIIVNDLLGLLKSTATDYRMYYDFIENHKPQLNSIKNLVFGSSNNSRGLIEDFLSTIIKYRYKPSQFKKYIQRLSTVL
jgi:hypothetical protein